MTKHVKWVMVLTVGLTLLFCSSFVFFYQRAQRRMIASAEGSAGKPEGIDKPLPEANLTDAANSKLDDRELREGRVVLVFVTTDCEACQREAEFLRTVVGKNPDLRFYGVVSYGDRESSLAAAEDMFPFKVFFDEGTRLASSLGITRIPVKVYLEDGVIKKAWGGATSDEEKKAAFTKWVGEVG